jgi:hypothetical protein
LGVERSRNPATSQDCDLTPVAMPPAQSKPPTLGVALVVDEVNRSIAASRLGGELPKGIFSSPASTWEGDFRSPNSREPEKQLNWTGPPCADWAVSRLLKGTSPSRKGGQNKRCGHPHYSKCRWLSRDAETPQCYLSDKISMIPAITMTTIPLNSI